MSNRVEDASDAGGESWFEGTEEVIREDVRDKESDFNMDIMWMNMNKIGKKDGDGNGGGGVCGVG